MDERIRELCIELELPLLTGFDDAIIGIAENYSDTGVAYDYNTIIDILMTEHKMTYEEAEEWTAYNIIRSCYGQGAPVIIKI